MSEKLIVSHYENNYGGAVKRLNAIEESTSALDPATTPGLMINGLKREQLIAYGPMVLHELFFEELGDSSEPNARMREALTRDFAGVERRHASSPPWTMPSATVRGGCCSPIQSAAPD